MLHDVLVALRCPICRAAARRRRCRAALPGRTRLRRGPPGVRQPERRTQPARGRHRRDGGRPASVPGRRTLRLRRRRTGRRGPGQPDPGALVLDAGTGTGCYLAGVLDALPAATGLGLDVSKPALRRAARAHPRAGAVLADLWRPLPVADAAAAADPGRVRAAQRRGVPPGAAARRRAAGRHARRRPPRRAGRQLTVCCGSTRTRPSGWPTAWPGTSRMARGQHPPADLERSPPGRSAP